MIRPRSILRWAALGVIMIVGLSCDESGLVVPEVPTVDLVGDVQFETSIRAGASLELMLEAEADVPLRVFAGGIDGAPTDSFVVIARAADGVTELGRTTVGGSGGIERARGISLPAFPTDQLLTLEVRGLRPNDAGRLRLLAEKPSIRPELSAQTIALGDTVFETFDGWADVDAFLIPLTAGDNIIVYLEKFGGSTSTEVTLSAYQTAVSIFPLVTSDRTGGSYTLEEHTITMIAASSGTYRIQVRGPTRQGSVAPWSLGAYRLHVRRSEVTPESAPASFVLGDTLRDALDYVGDVDRYLVNVVAGQRLEMLAIIDRPLESQIAFTVSRPTGFPEGNLLAFTQVADWPNAWSALYFPTQSGEVVVTVQGARSGVASRVTTPYAFTFGPQRVGPETLPAAATPGALLDGEALEGCADVDEFVVTPTVSSFVAIGVTRPVEVGCAFRVTLFSPTGQVLGGSGLILSRVDDIDSRRLPVAFLEAGSTYRVRVSPDRATVRSAPRTPFTLDFYAVDSLPEVASATVAFSDALVEETLTRCGDMDIITLPPAPTGTRLLISALLDRPTSCAVRLDVDERFFGAFWIPEYSIGVSGSATDLDAQTTGVTLKDAGPRRLAIRTASAGASADRGATVRFRVDTVRVAPEVAPSAVALGDTLTETLTRCGDVDDFTFAASGGEEILLAGVLDRAVSCRVTVLRLRPFSQADTLLVLLPGTSLDANRTLDRIQSAGTITYRVLSAPVGATADRGAEYRLSFTALNTSPEVAPSGITLSQPVTTEVLEDSLDVDVFTVNLTEGARYGFVWSGGITATLEGIATNLRMTENAFTAPNGSRYYAAFGVDQPSTYRVRITASATAASSVPYSFTLYEINPLAESVPSLQVGVPLVESLAPYGDRDEHRLVIDPTRWYRGRFTLAPGSFGSASIEANVPYAFGTYAPSSVPFVFQGAFGGTEAIFTVQGLLSTSTGEGSYELLVEEVNAAPENVSPSIALGDTIRNEQLDGLGDVDVFQLAVLAGQRFEIGLITSPECEVSSMLLLFQFTEASGSQPSTPSGFLGTILTATVDESVTITVLPGPGVCASSSYRIVSRLVP